MSIFAVLLLALLAGCASAPRADLPPGLFSDAAFAAPSEPADASQLFALSPDMRAYAHSPAFSQRVRDKGPVQGLLEALYKKGELRLEYESSMTRNAAQTFAARSGNCLSLVVMTAAFAKELGMAVRFQGVDVDDTWSRKASLYLASSHVNLALGRRPTDILHSRDQMERLVTVDFLPPPDAARFQTRQLEEDDIAALFLNNRAAEALVQGRIDDAYWWARAAVQAEPRRAIAYNTLGVIYQRHGDLAMAERAYRAALEREPENVAVMQNLGPVLAALGRPDEARAMAQRVASIQPFPPYHYFNKGMVALKAGDYDQARDLFEREVRRAPYNDEFHFWLAVTCLRLGEPQLAREQLTLAMASSTRPDSRERYAAKLVHLHDALAGARPN